MRRQCVTRQILADGPIILQGGWAAVTQVIRNAWIFRRIQWIVLYCLLPSTLSAQSPELPPSAAPAKEVAPRKEELLPAPTKVDVTPIARDVELRARLRTVLLATNWFTDPGVRVEQGVVLLSGTTKTDDLKNWAGELARNTQDVVAVANRIEVSEPEFWDFQPASNGLLVLWRDFIRTLPLAFFGLIILFLSAGIGMLMTRISRNVLRHRVQATLLRNTIARALGCLIFLIGIYIILRVAGLTQLALTVVGGTGLIGLAFGIAFRDITENFLASIFLSMQRPFETGDLIEVAGVTGYVQQLNVRVTVLMTLDGNVVQIPNATVYKSNIRNFSTNANRREDFLVGIGYDDPITDAQEIARQVLADHPAVLHDPEPSVLVDSLGAATVNLRVCFWLDGHEHSWLKVRSSAIRLIKLEFQKRGISLPDEAREVVFPNGVPVTIQSRKREATRDLSRGPQSSPTSSMEGMTAPSTKAEGGLTSEAGVIQEQARQVQPLHAGENLLKNTAGTSAANLPAGEPNTVKR